MNLQVSHPARSRLCLADGGHWLDEAAATVYGHRVTFSVRSHFPGPPWLRRFRLFSGSGWPVRSLRIWLAGPVAADLACPARSLRICPARSLRIWPGRSGPSRSGLADPVPPDLASLMRSAIPAREATCHRAVRKLRSRLVRGPVRSLLAAPGAARLTKQRRYSFLAGAPGQARIRGDFPGLTRRRGRPGPLRRRCDGQSLAEQPRARANPTMWPWPS
jgi:hypothetical protein